MKPYPYLYGYALASLKFALHSLERETRTKGEIADEIRKDIERLVLLEEKESE